MKNRILKPTSNFFLDKLKTRPANLDELVLFLKQVSIFANADENLLELVASCLVPVEIEAGKTLFSKGSKGESMYFIKEGNMIVHDGDYQIAELGTYNFFGEFSLLDTEKRSASVSAKTNSVLYRLGQDDFFNMIEYDPGLSAELFRALIQRFRSSNNKILEEYKNRQVVLEETIVERTKQIQEEKDIADQMRKRAEESEKFKQQFLANMSHEIRTPMNSIVGLANLLVNSPLNDQQKKYLHVIRKSSDNLLVIINDILDLSKIQAGKMVFEEIPFLLNDVLETVYHTLNFKAQEKKLEFSYHVQESIPKVLIGDPVRLNQVLINIIGNAIKFTEKGSVKLFAEDAGKDSKNNKSTLKFLVTDTGIGMNEEQQNKIFESFSQASSDTTRKYGGTGLGLTISKQLIESLGGEINVKSKEGEGTTFSFTLNYPIGSMNDIEKKEMNNIESITDRLKGIRILLVEDNEFNQMVAVDTLNDLIKDLTFDIAGNGLIALEKLNSNDFDIILMDVMMPEMDGFETTRNIRLLSSSKNKIPIIAMTANVTKEEIDNCFRSGMDEYVPKPFKHDDLLSKMSKLIHGK